MHEAATPSGSGGPGVQPAARRAACSSRPSGAYSRLPPFEPADRYEKRLLRVTKLDTFLGAFQFATGFRRRWPAWHRAAGRLLVVCGLLVGLSALWLTLSYPYPPGTGDLLHALRLVFGTAMVACVLLGFVAIRRRDVPAHRAWMARGYAIGLGAGTQVLVQLPWALTVGPPGEVVGALQMATSWAINLIVAEGPSAGDRPWRPGRRRSRPAGLPAHVRDAQSPPMRPEPRCPEPRRAMAFSPFLNSRRELRSGWWVVVFFLVLASIPGPVLAVTGWYGVEVSAAQQAVVLASASAACQVLRRRPLSELTGRVDARWLRELAAGDLVGAVPMLAPALVLGIGGWIA